MDLFEHFLHAGWRIEFIWLRFIRCAIWKDGRMHFSFGHSVEEAFLKTVDNYLGATVEHYV